MAYIVADPCVKCKYTDCVAVCPVDCFYEGQNSLVIHPEECIDCGACEPECPTTAIFEESDLPEKWNVYIGINAVFSGAVPEDEIDEIDKSDWPERLVQGICLWANITEQKDPLPTADAFSDKEDKLKLLDPESA